MTGSETKLVSYMEGSNKRFVIPVYQRNYDWKTENCRQLYDDLVKVIFNKRKSHFFGSMVCVYNPDHPKDEFLIIDGQQRLTTVSLLMLAMYNLINKKLITPAVSNLGTKIFNEYLVDQYQTGDARIKLKPVKNDRIAFAKLFGDKAEHIQESNLTINYNYFYDRIQREEISIDELYEAICRLEIINVKLNSDDNPQLIFESLNSTGVALSEGDKIRNFILMGLPVKEQTEYYEKYWNRIEEYTNYNVSAFIRDYLSVKQQMIPSQNKVYFTFKAYHEGNDIETEDLLIDLLAYAVRYRVLLTGNTKNKALNGCIYRLNRLETTVTRPFFLEILRLQEENMLTAEEVTEIFLVTESYLFRRTICDLPTNTLNKIFLSLHKEIMRYDGNANNYIEKFKYTVLSKKDRARFPEDSEFTSAFSQRQIYLMNSKNKIYLLERLENFGTLEDKDVYRHFDSGDYSIEHIMPQHLTPVWIKALGDDFERIHETWLHRIANLTLTAYNTKYSNNSFEDKKTMKNGFNDSGIRMNIYIARKTGWTLTELEERSEYLSERALEIWRMPVTDFKPAEKQMDSFSLDDDAPISGRSIAKFVYKNTEQPAASWVDMYERVLKILHTEDKSVLSRLAYSKDRSNELEIYVSNNPSDLRAALEIDENIYTERNTSTALKLSLLRRFFKLYDADPTDLVFVLRNEADAVYETDIGTRYELRKRYWTFALDDIKQANSGNGAFANAAPSKSNCINGYFGIGGFNLCCVANYNGARVELYLAKGNAKENKAAFDMLYAYKNEIERKLGIRLEWDRGDGYKFSKVYCKLDDVSIEAENDWLRMAKFHAERSRKFYDVFVPYLM